MFAYGLGVKRAPAALASVSRVAILSCGKVLHLKVSTHHRFYIAHFGYEVVASVTRSQQKLKPPRVGNERSRKVEADVVMCPRPSLLRREETRDSAACVPFALNSY